MSRLSIDYGKQPLLFLSFNYPQRDVWPLFILSNLCCFYRSIILNAPFTLFTLSNLCCFYRPIIVNVPFSHCVYQATLEVFIVQLCSTRRLAIVYNEKPFYYRSIILDAPVSHCIYKATLFYRSIILNATFTLFT